MTFYGFIIHDKRKDVLVKFVCCQNYYIKFGEMVGLFSVVVSKQLVNNINFRDLKYY